MGENLEISDAVAGSSLLSVADVADGGVILGLRVDWAGPAPVEVAVGLALASALPFVSAVVAKSQTPRASGR